MLIFLDVSYPVSLRRKNLGWTLEEYQEQQRRLAHARAHADYYLMTDDLTPGQVAQKVIEFLIQAGVLPPDIFTAERKSAKCALLMPS
jgi:hypothetical protein